MGKSRVLVLFLAAALFFTGCSKKEEKAAPEAGAAPVEEMPIEEEKVYAIEEDKIPSIDAVLQEARVPMSVSGYGIVSIPGLEEEEATPEDKKKKKKKEKKSEEELKAEADALAAAEEAAKIPILTYQYSVPQIADEDVRKYVAYLQEKYGFRSTMEVNLQNPAGYIALSRDSMQPNYFFTVDIDYTKNDYSIILERVKKPEPEREEKVNGFKSRKEALEALKGVSAAELGIPEDPEGYTYIPNPGRSIVDGKTSFGINIYKTMEDSTNRIIGMFFVPLDKSGVYKYDLQTNTYSAVKNSFAPPKVAEAEKEEPKTPIDILAEAYPKKVQETPFGNPIENIMGALYPPPE